MKRPSKKPNAPEVVEVDRNKLEEVICRAEQALGQEDGEYIRAVFESYEYHKQMTRLMNQRTMRPCRLPVMVATAPMSIVVRSKSKSRTTALPQAIFVPNVRAANSMTRHRAC